MPHEIAELQHYAGALGRFLEGQYMVGLGGVRFLHQHVLARGDRIEDHGIAGGRIHRQEDGFHLFVGQQVLVGSVQTRDSLLTADPVPSFLEQVA